MSFKKKIVQQAARLFMALHISTLFSIKFEGFSLRFYPSHCSKLLWLKQYIQDSRYDEEESFFRTYLRKGDAVIDIGANIGFLSLLSASLVGSDGHVYSFEPNKRIYEYLRGNIEFNSFNNLNTFNMALGNEKKTSHLNDKTKKDSHGFITDGEGMEVPMSRLDDIEINEDPIALMKLDVEGYEKFVLEGSHETLLKTQCVYFEAASQNLVRFGHSLADLFAIFNQAGLKIYILGDNGTVDDFDQSSCQVENETCNLLAIRDIDAFVERTGYKYNK